MALSDAEKTQIRKFLGFGDVNRITSSHLESAMDALSPEGEDAVRAILVQLAVIETNLTTAWSSASVVRVEDVWFSRTDALLYLRNEGQRLVMDMAYLLSITPNRMPFSGAPMVGTF